MGKLDLKINIVVNGSFRGGACGNVKRKGLGQSGNELEDEENYRVDEWG